MSVLGVVAIRLLCLGDSNTYGYDPRGFLGDRYKAADRWVNLLAAQTGWDVINAGVNGRTIPYKHDTFLSLPIHTDADICLVMLGTNDLLQGATVKEAAARMECFLRLLQPHCRRILLVAPPPMKLGAWVSSEELVHKSIRLADEYQTVAQKLNISFVDTRHWCIALAFDGVHFTEAGHHTFADQLIECL